jgi:PilZ domain-containing protein
MGRRDRERVPAIVPVRIWGTNRNERPFSEYVCTVNISGTGARLGGVRSPLAIGDTVGLQYRTRQARFRVVWTVESGVSWGNEVGLQCLQPEKNIWQTDLPEPAPDRYEVPDVKTRNYASRHRGRRSHTRFPISGYAFVSVAHGSAGFAAKLGDISLNGCYVETGTPLHAGRTLTLLLKIGNYEIRAAGVVRVLYEGVAMGIEFTHLNPADQRTLNELISRLKAAETPPPVALLDLMSISTKRIESEVEPG